MKRGLRRRYGRSAATDKARWDALRATYATKNDAAVDYRLGLESRYGARGDSRWRSWISRGEKTKLERLEAARDKVGDKIIDLIVKVSPRGEAWLSGAPSFWLREKLTWEDATRPVGEPLSVEVPAPWGSNRGLQ